MTQDKAPEWALKAAQRLVYSAGDAVALASTQVTSPGQLADFIIRMMAPALSQAHKRGQESMRERAAAWHDGFNEHELKLAASYLKAGLPFDAEAHGRKAEVHNNAASFIRSLPIEQEGRK